MSKMEEHAAAKELSKKLGFRLIDDNDWMFDDNGKRVSARNAYWFVLSGQDDERLDQPVRYGQWPRPAEIVIQHLWHCCVTFSVENATKAKLDANKRFKLSVLATGVLIGSLAIPLLLGGLHLVNLYQVNLFWHYGAYLAAVALGTLVAGWWTRL
jgi:hypothetical protein